MHIAPAIQISEEIVAAFQRLVPQLSASSPPPTERELNTIISSKDALLYLARDENGTIVGSLTLIFFRIPTGLRARIEDVVVDETARGKGIGEALTRTALEKAGQFGAPYVDLTSNPARQAANRLYQRMGFQCRETNVYRYFFED
jgi:ribosomal protein S18 acetylase RimI-like enzyme